MTVYSFHYSNTGRQLIVNVEIKNKLYSFIIIHAPNELIHSISVAWTKVIRTYADILALVIDNKCKITIDKQYINIEDVSTKEIYIHILVVFFKCKPPTSKKRWIELHDEMNLDENFWQLIYETPFHLTNNAKILVVQYKTIHIILAVNHNFKKWDRIESSKCEICDTDVETIEPFIYECPNTKALWTTRNTWCKNEFLFAIPITSPQFCHLIQWYLA